MEPKRRQRILLGVVMVVLGGLLAYRFWPAQAPGGAPASNGRGARAGAVGRGAPDPALAPVSDVHLDALNAKRPEPERTERNLFRFKPKAPPPAPPSPALPGPGAATGPPAPPPAPAGPPPPPPITLKFIGIVESGGAAAKLAVLSDGRAVYQGREGDIIEGRYRIVRIGTESIEMAYLDGRGRQTIRLTGQ